MLLLEAGTDYQDEMYDVPWNAPSAQMTEADWGFYSTPQKHGCQGMKEQVQFRFESVCIHFILMGKRHNFKVLHFKIFIYLSCI